MCILQVNIYTGDIMEPVYFTTILKAKMAAIEHRFSCILPGIFVLSVINPFKTAFKTA